MATTTTGGNGKAAAAMPQVIYIIRHGEKPGQPVNGPFGIDVSGQRNVDSLIPRGWQRAGALAALFAPAKGQFRKGIESPSALFSPDYSDALLHRTHETILPLSQRLNLTIATPAPVGSEAAAIHQALRSGAKTALICWEHDHIPLLAAALPLAAGSAIPQTWPDTRFDVVWRFELDTTGKQPCYRFSQIPQRLLAGDSNTVIAATAAPHHRRGPGGSGLQ